MLYLTKIVSRCEATVAGVAHANLNNLAMVARQVDDHHREEMVFHIGSHAPPDIMNGVMQAETTYLLILSHLFCLAVEEADALTVACKDIKVLALAHHHVFLNQVLIEIWCIVRAEELDILIFFAVNFDGACHHIVFVGIKTTSVLLIVC